MFRWRPAANRLAASALCQCRMANLQDLQLSGIFINLCAECKRVFLTVLFSAQSSWARVGKLCRKAAPHSVRVFRPLICKLADRSIVCRRAKPRDDWMIVCVGRGCEDQKGLSYNGRASRVINKLHVNGISHLGDNRCHQEHTAKSPRVW